MNNVAAAQEQGDPVSKPHTGTATIECNASNVSAPAAAPNTKGDPAQARESGVSRGTVSSATFHDHLDRGNPLVKVYPLTDWRSWARRTDFDPRDF